MHSNIDLLISKFNKIKNMGWVQSITKGTSGIGLTLENLIGVTTFTFLSFILIGKNDEIIL